MQGLTSAPTAKKTTLAPKISPFHRESHKPNTDIGVECKFTNNRERHIRISPASVNLPQLSLRSMPSVPRHQPYLPAAVHMHAFATRGPCGLLLGCCSAPTYTRRLSHAHDEMLK